MSTQQLTAEMVANVWKCEVQVGDSVAAGDTVVVLESMKMEIPVIAEESGIIEQIHVVEGSVVQEGDLIATIVPV